LTKFIKKVSKKTGLIPGTLFHIGEKREGMPRITIIDYDEIRFQEKEAKRVEECFLFKESSTVTWINVDGVQVTEIIEKIGKEFDIHPLVLEDIVNTGHRPKLEDFEQYMFVVLKMLYWDKKTDEIVSEQVSLLLGKNFVISFQEKEGDVFNPIRERIKSAKGRTRKAGADYLMYTLIDVIVDNYFLVLENIGEKIEGMEEELIANPTPQTLQTIHDLKREILVLRKSVWPLREVISGLQRSESPLLSESTGIFLRDVYDHTIQVVDTIETFRDLVSGMLDIYLSSLSNKMNEIMKVLTIIATIFIPITFIAGIYGMNFNSESSFWNMPELNWKFGYLFVWMVIIIMGMSMVFYFKRKRWL